MARSRSSWASLSMPSATADSCRYSASWATAAATASRPRSSPSAMPSTNDLSSLSTSTGNARSRLS